ncbi:MAG: hypothetical protein J5J06_13440 [Phycisphaerae bacterium]|nr:hypothetical protein [Phycisphaerae bacterium]
MNQQIRHRMSPLTAFFIGLFGLGISLVASVTVLALYGLKIVDSASFQVVQVVSDTIQNLPDIVDDGHDVLSKLLHDERATGYAKNIEVEATLLGDTQTGRVYPALKIRNNGDREVTLLGVRVAALDDAGVARAEWTEVVATPLTIEDEWRGPLQPGATRHVVVRSWRGIGIPAKDERFHPAVEITDVRAMREDVPAVVSEDAVANGQ